MSNEISNSSYDSQSSKLLPNVSRLSEALMALSEELPRLSNLDSHSFLDILEDLRRIVRQNADTQMELKQSLDQKLSNIEEKLSSLEYLIVNGGLSLRHRLEDEETFPEDAPQDNTDDFQASQQKIGTGNPSRKSGLFEGPTGAFLIMGLTLIPILAILFFPDSLNIEL